MGALGGALPTLGGLHLILGRNLARDGRNLPAGCPGGSVRMTLSCPVHSAESEPGAASRGRSPHPGRRAAGSPIRPRCEEFPR